MGFFSGEKIVAVSSTAYNLAGPLEKRAAYLKSTVARATLVGNPRDSLGRAIVDGQLNGPTFQQRRFFRWSQDNYVTGQITGVFSSNKSVEAEDVKPFISSGPNELVIVERAFIDVADITYFAEKRVFQTRPEMFGEAWTIDTSAGLSGVIIQYPDGSSDVADFSSFETGASYLVAYYQISDTTDVSYSVTGSLITDDNTRPDTSGWDNLTSVVYSENVTLTETVSVTTNGGPPDVTTEDTIVSFSGLEETWNKSEYQSINPNEEVIYEDQLDLWIKSKPKIVSNTVITEEEINGDTVVTETTTESIETVYDHQTDEIRDITVFDYRSTPGIFLYKIGDGNVVLDALKEIIEADTNFFPVMPLRVSNKSLRHPDFAGLYGAVDKAYKRSTGGDLNQLLDNIEDNEQLDDIDYAYLVHGVEVNTQEEQGRKYLYNYFLNLAENQPYDYTEFTDFESRSATYDAYIADLQDWENDQINEGPRFGEAPPTNNYFKPPRTSSLSIATTNNPDLNYRTEIMWIGIWETIVPGVGKPGAKQGDLWWDTNIPDTRFPGMALYNGSFAHHQTSERVYENARLYWQDEPDSYRYLTLTGFRHENLIYKGNSVQITLKNALNDPDESGFIIPLHYQTLKDMRLVDANELVASSKLIVFNSYEIQTVRWYEKELFKIVVVVTIAVVAGPTGAGILGTNLAVGTGLGLTGLAAVIAGAVANALAGVLIEKAIGIVASELFGDDLGRIIAVITSYVITTYTGGVHEGKGWGIDWGDMLKTDTLLKLTNAATGLLEAWTQQEMGNIREEYAAAKNDYEEASDEISRRSEELLGYSGIALDPLMSVQRPDPMNRVESSETFLSRTLLTGSDIADISLTMIESYPELSLTLPRAIK